MTRFSPSGLATGIGSTPFSDPSEALSLIRKYMPAIPHWPQMPRRGIEEGFVYQFLKPLVDTGLLVTHENNVCFDAFNPGWPDHLTEFYTTSLAAEAGNRDALQSFALSERSAGGFYAFLTDLKNSGLDGIKFLKGQIVGPLTAGFQLKDSQDRPAYYDEQLRDVIVRTLAMQARWQAVTLSDLGRPAIIFVDEPAISAYGSGFNITVTRDMILEDLETICRAVHHENAMIGVHSCEVADWSLLFENDLDIVNPDTYHFGDSLICYSESMKNFLARGGVMAWGIVPTLNNVFKADAESLLDRLKKIWSELNRKGVDRKTLLEQSLITPVCGTGFLQVDQAERVYQLTAEISKNILSWCRGT